MSWYENPVQLENDSETGGTAPGVRCPECGESYGGLHPTGVVAPFTGVGDDADQGGWRVFLKCECGHEAALCVGNHKGTLFLYWK